MTKVFMFLFRILVGSIGVFLSGYIFKTGWNWFFATAYNLPMATLKAGVGFSMLLSLAAFGEIMRTMGILRPFDVVKGIGE